MFPSSYTYILRILLCMYKLSTKDKRLCPEHVHYSEVLLLTPLENL